jgi:hypothetical protein
MKLKLSFLFWLIFVLMNTLVNANAASSTTSGYFHGVLFKGEIANVRLHPTRGLSYVVAHGASDDIANLTMIEHADKLHVIMERGYPKQGPVTIDVYINDYRGITTRGHIPITGHGIYSRALVLSANGDANIDLSGNINLANIHARGKTHIEMTGVHSRRSKIELFDNAYAKITGMVGICELNIHHQSCLIMHWVNATSLKFVLGDNAYVQLAGHVNLLDAELFEKSKLAARFLRSERTFVKTHDDSVAEISTVRAQHTYAIDRSHIDYFNVPLYKTDMMVENGAVLDLREWYLSHVQENIYFEE